MRPRGSQPAGRGRLPTRRPDEAMPVDRTGKGRHRRALGRARGGEQQLVVGRPCIDLGQPGDGRLENRDALLGRRVWRRSLRRRSSCRRRCPWRSRTGRQGWGGRLSARGVVDHVTDAVPVRRRRRAGLTCGRADLLRRPLSSAGNVARHRGQAQARAPSGTVGGRIACAKTPRCRARSQTSRPVRSRRSRAERSGSRRAGYRSPPRRGRRAASGRCSAGARSAAAARAP